MNKLPNGETLEEFKSRNLQWWKASKDYELKTRPPYYDNFIKGLKISSSILNKKTIEIGPGAVGGLLMYMNPTSSKNLAFADILMYSLKDLELVSWPEDSTYYTCPMEDMSIIEDNEYEYLVSYNTLDHGYDIYEALSECFRVSEHGYIAFDCKADTAPPHDRLDHYQEVWYDRIVSFLEKKFPKVSYGKLTPNNADASFKYGCNWGFPVIYIKY